RPAERADDDGQHRQIPTGPAHQCGPDQVAVQSFRQGGVVARHDPSPAARADVRPERPPPMMKAAVSPPIPGAGMLAPTWSNWRLAALVAVIAIPLAVLALPERVAFWVALAAVIGVAVTAVVNAWGRYTGGLLVAPALALLFVMNIFPLLWSFGLSFFNYRSNRARAPSWVGLDNYANVLSDPEVWNRLHNTIILVLMTVTAQLVVGFLLPLFFAKQFPLRRFLLILVLTPMMLSFVAVGAFFRYYYDPTFGLLSQAVRLFTGQPYILMNTVWGSRIGIVFAD